MPDPSTPPDDASLRASWAREVRTRLSSLGLSPTREAEIVEELSQHLDDRWRELIAGGRSPDEATQLTLADFRDTDALARYIAPLRQAHLPRSITPGAPTGRLLGDLWQDLRYAACMLRKQRGFAAAAVVTLALGIGASSAIFSLINAIVLRPLPVADPHELFIAQAAERDQVNLRFSYPVVERAREVLAGRAQVAAQSSVESVLIGTRGSGVGATPPEAARLQLVAGDFFGTLRQRAQIGRLLDHDDNRSLGQHPVAVISDGYWSRRFGRTARVLDTELIINGTSMAIVGVAARVFFGATVDTQGPDVWAPAAMQAALRFNGNVLRTGGDLQKPWPSQPELTWLQVIIRAPADGRAAAAEAMTLALQHESPAVGDRDDGAARVTLLAGSRGFSLIRSELTTPLIVLFMAVGLLLAIACANIASLLLARATSRGREMAIRLSMGAGRGRLIRQLLTESLLLASIGGISGLALASWGSTALLMFLTRGAPITGIDVGPDWRVVALTFATSIATAMMFGLLPAVRGTRVPLAESLKTHGVIGAAGRGGRVQVGKLLITGQMALAILLLLVAALFARSLQALTRVDVGYDRDQLLVARIDARSAGYPVAELPALHTRLVERLVSLPGVISVSASANGPFSGSRARGDFAVEGYTSGRDERMVALYEWVTSDYFRTVGLAIKQGRSFGPEDSANSRRVSIINETMARRYFGNQDPLGRRWGRSNQFDRDGFEIVGVVENARYNDVRAESLNMAYLPATQTERYLTSVEVRTAGNPTSLANAARNALRESEPRLAVGAIETLDSRIVRSIGVDRLLGWLTMAFGAAALGLACLGLYGTISYSVRRRTAELGIRIALGADRVAVQWLIVREALLLVLVGGAIGLPLAFLAARTVGGLLYATAPFDPVAYGTAVGMLVVVSAFAAYIPARRASRLDPMVALKTE